MNKRNIGNGATLLLLTQIVLQSPCWSDMPPYHQHRAPIVPEQELKKPQVHSAPAKKPQLKTQVNKTENSDNKTNKETAESTTTK